LELVDSTPAMFRARFSVQAAKSLCERLPT
jgi:hypothetical protein